MNHCAGCNQPFEPRQPHHRYCQALLTEPTATSPTTAWPATTSVSPALPTSYHRSLRVALPLPCNRRHWVSRTPAMAAGITDHRWTVEELLSFRVPLPRWTPPKRRDPHSKATKALVAQWCSWPRLNGELPRGQYETKKRGIHMGICGREVFFATHRPWWFRM